MPGHTRLCQAEDVFTPGQSPAAWRPASLATAGLGADAAGDVLLPGCPFTAAELSAMDQAGLVRPLLGGLYRPRASPVTSRLRALAVREIAAPVLAGHWCAVGRTAAWVQVGGPPPPRLEAGVSHYHRPPSHALAIPLVLRELDVASSAGSEPDPHEDVLEVHGLRCTTVERTLEDLLRLPEPQSGDLGHHHAVERLISLCAPDTLRARFHRRRRLPGMLRARSRLETLLGSA